MYYATLWAPEVLELMMWMNGWLAGHQELKWKEKANNNGF